MLAEDELWQLLGDTFGDASNVRVETGTMISLASLPRVWDGRPRSGSAPEEAGRPTAMPGTAVPTGGGAHFSSLQLCLIELEAIMAATARTPDLKYVLYVGAAPGDHIVALMELFPNLEFHLVDPAPSLVSAQLCKCLAQSACPPQVYKKTFTDDDAVAWGASGRMSETIFICDAHSGGPDQAEYEAEIECNMDRQRGWWAEMQPAASLLKFRLPQSGVAYDYLDGQLLLQPFGPVASEGRLLVWKGAGSREYSPEAYGSYFRWLNSAVRGRSTYDHKLATNLVPGLCHCFDCARTVQILREYVAANPAPDLFSTKDQHLAYRLGRMVAVTEQRLASRPHRAKVESHAGRRGPAARPQRGRGGNSTAIAMMKTLAAPTMPNTPAAPTMPKTPAAPTMLKTPAVLKTPATRSKATIDLSLPSARALRAKK